MRITLGAWPSVELGYSICACHANSLGEVLSSLVIFVLRGDSMCDVKKYSDIYKEIAKLNPKDTLQLVLESETDEEKDFYEMVGDFLLQRRQKEVIERNLF